MERTFVRVAAHALRRGSGEHEVHAARWPSEQPGTVVCLHGLGGSHLNWVALGQALTRYGTVWAPDLAGFGLTSPKAVNGGRRSASLADNLDLAIGFIQTVVSERLPPSGLLEPLSSGRVLLMGNSMGGLLALMLASRRPDLVRGLVLVNPALPSPIGTRLDPQVVASFAAFALPGVGERFLARRTRRLTPEDQVRDAMALVAADPSALDADLITQHVELARQRRELPYAHQAFLEAARSIVQRVTVRHGRVWRDIQAVEAPTLLLTGARDRLVRSAAPQRVAARRPDWTVVQYEDLGHIPQLEDPARVAADIADWSANLEPAPR